MTLIHQKSYQIQSVSLQRVRVAWVMLRPPKAPDVAFEGSGASAERNTAWLCLGKYHFFPCFSMIFENVEKTQEDGRIRRRHDEYDVFTCIHRQNEAILFLLYLEQSLKVRHYLRAIEFENKWFGQERERERSKTPFASVSWCRRQNKLSRDSTLAYGCHFVYTSLHCFKMFQVSTWYFPKMTA